MLDYNVKIGLVPLRRDCTPRPGAFNWEIAQERGCRIVAYIKEHYATPNVTFADLKGVIDSTQRRMCAKSQIICALKM